MKKLLLIPKSLDEINKTKDIVDGFIVGIKNYSVNMNLYIDINDIKDLPTDKEIFISLNKNFNSTDIKNIEKLLLDLNNYNIKGVLFYDVGVLNIYNRLDLNYDLVLSQEHLSTNYNTINFYYDNGVNYAYLSSDITKEEIDIIKKNTKIKIMVNAFGYLPMFVSKRHIVKNYLDNFKLEDSSKINYIEKEGNIYPIIDTLDGTYVYSANIQNGLIDLIDIDYDYNVINSFEIEDIEEVLDIFKNVNNENKYELNEKLSSKYKNMDTGFLNKKTIYKVKK